MNHFYVVTSTDDPGSIHDSLEEAQKVLKDLEKEGYKPIIFGPEMSNQYPDWMLNEMGSD